jgi:hypothetical protein
MSARDVVDNGQESASGGGGAAADEGVLVVGSSPKLANFLSLNPAEGLRFFGAMSGLSTAALMDFLEREVYCNMAITILESRHLVRVGELQQYMPELASDLRQLVLDDERSFKFVRRLSECDERLHSFVLKGGEAELVRAEEAMEVLSLDPDGRYLALYPHPGRPAI